jgi:AraC-like DNA-binding protein
MGQTEMAWSAALRFTDPHEFQIAVQGAHVEVFPTARGAFDSEITKVRFERLWMQRFRWHLPQIITVLPKPDRKAINFLTEPKSAELYYCGVEVVPGEIIIPRNDVAHERFGGGIRAGAMSLPAAELNAAFKAVTGREIPDSHSKCVICPDPNALQKLLSVHKAVGRLAHDTPDILELPTVARALEEQLIHLMVRCLAEGVALNLAPVGHRHEVTMTKFEEFLEAHPDQPLHLIEICEGIGVAERTLRACCEEHLGMGPIRYLTLRRMHLVRRALRRADPSTSNVTRIVTDYGFWELGRFAVAYRLMFGESPSMTLQRPAERSAIRLDRPSSLTSRLCPDHHRSASC